MANLLEAVPFLAVRSMDQALAFYRDGLGFEVKLTWEPEGAIRWCQIERDAVHLMLQEYAPGHEAPAEPRGVGVTLTIVCQDALAIHLEARARGLQPDRPFVGNGMWVVGFRDPDGYRLEFESLCDLPEGTVCDA